MPLGDPVFIKMSNIILKLKVSLPHINTFRQWGALIARFASIEMLVKVIGLAINFIVIRYAAKADYGLFTIASSMVFMLNTLSDSGISSGTSAVAGEVWRDRGRFSELIRTSLRLRRSMVVFMTAAILPIAVWLLDKNGASYGNIAVLSALILLTAVFMLQSSIYATALKFYKKFDTLQYTKIIADSTRLVAVLMLSAVAYLGYESLNVLTLTAVFSLGAGISAFRLRYYGQQLIDDAKTINEQFKARITKVLKRQLPNDLYYAVNGQLSIFLISLFGTVSLVAEVGALSRLAMVLSIITITADTVVLPEISKARTRSGLLRRVVVILGIYLLLSLAVITVTYLFPGQILLVLGEKYGHLERELLLMITSSLLGVIAGVLFRINAMRGWVLSPWLNVPVTVGTQALLIWWLDVSTVRGILTLNIFAVMPALVMNASQFFIYLKKVGR